MMHGQISEKYRKKNTKIDYKPNPVRDPVYKGRLPIQNRSAVKTAYELNKKYGHFTRKKANK